MLISKEYNIKTDSIKDKIVVVAGPTASGKSSFAVKLAGELDGEIINGDAMQMYKDAPVITNIPTAEEQMILPHHLFSIWSSGFVGSVQNWLDVIVPKINIVRAKNKTPIIVGGTGLYLSSLVSGLSEVPNVSLEIRKALDEELKIVGNEKLFSELKIVDPITAKKLNVGDTQRITRALSVFREHKKPLSFFNSQAKRVFYNYDEFFVININPPRDLLYDRINSRFDNMLKKGALDEATYINNNIDIYADSTLLKAIGLRELLSYLSGEISLDKAIDDAKQHSRNYAKRQITWFRNTLKCDLVIDKIFDCIVD